MPTHFSYRSTLRRIGLAAPLTFVFGLMIGMITNAGHSFIDSLLRDVFQIQSPIWGALVTLFALVLIATAFVVILWRLAPPVVPFSGDQQPARKKGLILLVSNASSAEFAIRYHLIDGPLEKVWLIPSHGNEAVYFGQGTGPIAEEIKKHAGDLATQQGRKLDVIIHPTGVSPADAQETYDYVRRILRQRPFPPHELIADFTGGTKPMTMGMIMACLSAERELEYVSLHPPSGTMHGPFRIEYRPEAFDLGNQSG